MNMVISLPAEFRRSCTSCKIDGATSWKASGKYAASLPTTFLVLVMTTISSFQIFDLAVIMTEGGPYATNTIVYHLPPCL